MPLAIVGNTFTSVWADREKILISEKTKAKIAHGGVDSTLLHQLFADTDVDGSGVLERTEFIEFMTAFNLGFTVQQIKKIFRTLDINCSGVIGFKEFHSATDQENFP